MSVPIPAHTLNQAPWPLPIELNSALLQPSLSAAGAVHSLSVIGHEPGAEMHREDTKTSGHTP